MIDPFLIGLFAFILCIGGLALYIHATEKKPMVIMPQPIGKIVADEHVVVEYTLQNKDYAELMRQMKEFVEEPSHA